MQRDTASYSSIGGRECNEDYVAACASPGFEVYVVADGLGGHDCGEIASRLAANVFCQALEGFGQPTKDRLESALVAANDTVSAGSADMRTTLSAVVLCDDSTALFINIGDTRIYQFRDCRVRFQSRDHSVAQIAAAAGDISQDEVRNTPLRNRLLRSLGSDEQPRGDVGELDVVPGDAFLICSDGLWEAVTEEEMLHELSQASTAEQWIDGMRSVLQERTANARDNNSAIAIRVR